MNSALAYGSGLQRRGIDQYNQSSILNASPSELILKLYDLGIVSIRKGDFQKSNRVLTELIAALNFEYQDEALGLFKLYRYCQECLFKKNSAEPLQILQELRNSWAEAFELT